MARKGFALCIQYHIWMNVTAVAYHAVYEKSVPKHHQQCYGNMETDTRYIISSMTVFLKRLCRAALNKSVF